MRIISPYTRFLSLILALLLIFQLSACGFVDTAKEAASTVSSSAISAKNSIVNWLQELDMSKFKDGWDAAADFAGSTYSAAMGSEYVQSVSQAITDMKVDMNKASGSLRSTAHEAGFLAEKWVADTFNIDAAVNESQYSAGVVGSNKLGSTDVTTNYGENASLKYYKDATSSAKEQARAIIEAYKKYESANKGTEKLLSLEEYMDKHEYSSTSQDDLMASLYTGQTRIIPEGQIEDATEFLNGRIDKLSNIGGDVASGRTKAYQETVGKLKDRLVAPDGTSSKPASYDEMQAIAELCQAGKFTPEDFGYKLSQIIPAKYVVKQAIGTGLEVAALETVLTVGPDIVSILIEAARNGEFDEEKLDNLGVETVISSSEGFVEGSLSRLITTLCANGTFGEALKKVTPDIVGSLVVLTIESIILGYSLSKGMITSAEYGNEMADKILLTALSIPTTYLMLKLLPATKLVALMGEFAGCTVAMIGYTFAKEAVLEFADGGGFEAIVPEGVSTKLSAMGEKIQSLHVTNQLSNLKQFAITTANDGLILIKGASG